MQRVWTMLLAMSGTAFFLLIAPAMFARLGDIDVIRNICLALAGVGGGLCVLCFITAAQHLPRYEMPRFDHLLFIGSGMMVSTITVLLIFAFKDPSVVAMLGFGIALALATIFCGKNLQEVMEEAANQKAALLERTDEIVRDQQAPLPSAKSPPIGCYGYSDILSASGPLTRGYDEPACARSSCDYNP